MPLPDALPVRQGTVCDGGAGADRPWPRPPGGLPLPARDARRHGCPSEYLVLTVGLLPVRDFVLFVTLIANILSLFVMVATILMHSGRGGGLSDMFGGAGTTALGSTAAERNLTRITVVFTIIWFGTVIALSFLLVT